MKVREFKISGEERLLRTVFGERDIKMVDGIGKRYLIGKTIKVLQNDKKGGERK